MNLALHAYQKEHRHRSAGDWGLWPFPYHAISCVGTTTTACSAPQPAAVTAALMAWRTPSILPIFKTLAEQRAAELRSIAGGR